jgi:hypothetical protein
MKRNKILAFVCRCLNADNLTNVYELNGLIQNDYIC